MKNAALDLKAESTHESVTDGFGCRARYPVLDKIAILTQRGIRGDCVSIEDVEQKIAPARQEQCTIVVLDRQHVLRRKGVFGKQAITNLARSRAKIVAAITDNTQRFGIRDTSIRRPDTTALRVHDAWIVGWVQPPLPAMPGAPVSR